MRILIAHSAYRVFGGENKYVQALPEMLGGHEVCSFVLDNADLPHSPAAARRMLGSKQVEDEVSRTIDSFRPDIIHLHNPYPALGPAVHNAAERRSIPLVFTVHNHRLRCPNGLFFTEGQPCIRCLRGNYTHAIVHNCLGSRSQSAAYAVILWIHRFLLRIEAKIRVFIAPSEFMAGAIQSWGVRGQVCLVRHFARPLEGHEVRPSENGLFAGRLSPEKGLPRLLEALRIAENPPFVIAGDGPMRTALEAEAGRLGLSNTRFVGNLDPIRLGRAFNDSGYLVVPSEWAEIACLSGIEAMAMGRGLIVSDQGALPELVAQGGGFTFPAGDAAALASAISQMRHRDVSERAGREALATYHSTYTPSAHVRSLEGAYNEALQ